MSLDSGRTDNAISKKFAVVTGASSGIGLQLARVFAENGHDLVINAEDDKIFEAVQQIRSFGDVDITAVKADLRDFDGVEELWRVVKSTGRPVDAVAINAGVGVGGDFARETKLNDEINMIKLNVIAVVHLAKLALKDMVTRNSGRILVTSSIAGVMPTPLSAVYGATKAFDLWLVKSLRYELKDTNVTLTALQPGETNTNFFRREGWKDTKIGAEGKYNNDPLEVAKQGYEAMMDGKEHVFAESLMTKIQGGLGALVPDALKAKLHMEAAKPAKAGG